MIRYALPDFTVGLGLNLFFIRLSEQRPEWFQDDVHIDSVYGCFPGCIMNGGRTYVRERVTKAQMEETFGLLSEHGVKPRFTFTNMLAGTDELDDPYFNEMLEVAAPYGAEAIVYSDVVGDYLRERYDMTLVLSTTRALSGVEELNCMTKRYDYVVLDYNLHKDPAYLAAIEQPTKVELMVNEFCQRGCPHRQEHYRHNSQDQMDATLHPFECIATHADFFEHPSNHPVIFTDDEVRATYERYGIECCKIVGRGIAFQTVLEAYVYYLVKPAYRDAIRRLVTQASSR